MSPLILPAPIAAYFAADRQTPDTVTHCFTEQATVRDEGRTHSGRNAIRAWKAAASTQYTYRADPFALAQEQGRHVVTSRVSGNFPGSPVDLRYRFGLEGDLIASLEISA